MDCRLYTAIAFCLAISFSCKKEEPEPEQPKELVNTELKSGLPSRPDNIHGYLYMSKQNYFSAGVNMTFFAAFKDPSENVSKVWDHYSERTFGFSTVNHVVFVGKVHAGNIELMNNGVFYQSGQTLGAAPLSWRTEGKKTFAPINVQLTRGYPALLYQPENPVMISRSGGWHMDLKDLATNFDSVTVMLRGNSFLPLQKTVAAGDPSGLTLLPEDLSEFDDNYYTLILMAFNYSNMTVNSKSYLFELSTRHTTSATLTD